MAFGADHDIGLGMEAIELVVEVVKICMVNLLASRGRHWLVSHHDHSCQSQYFISRPEITMIPTGPVGNNETFTTF